MLMHCICNVNNDEKSVQHMWVFVVNFFRIFEIILLLYVVVTCDLLHYVENIHGI